MNDETIRAVKIESGTYRVGRYVAFETIRRDWKMGEPIDADDLAAGMVAGTVTFHSTLGACVSSARARARQEARS